MRNCCAAPWAIERALPAALALYRYWFRVKSEGHEHLPRRGGAILVANHGGLLPFDGAMAALDALLHTDPPRLLRPLVARFVRDLPLLRDFYAGIGPVIGTRDNFRQLLERRELVLVFPEGVEGIKKTVPDRYRLQHFHPGFVEESVRLRVPVIPVAIIGPDDQAPILYDVKTIARWLRLPAFPITPTFPWLGPLGLLPYPVRYRMAIEPGFVETAIWGKVLPDADQPLEIGGAYRPYLQAMRDFEGSITERSTPEQAAEEVFAAVTDESDRLRYPIAAYARSISSARRAMGDRTFMRFFHKRWMGPES